MKTFVTLLILAFSLNSIAQERIFTLNWKKGDQKTIKVDKVQKYFEDGELTLEESSYEEIKIEVLEENDNSYILLVSKQNEVIAKAAEVFEDLPEALQMSAVLPFKYQVIKEDAHFTLLNWEAVKKEIDASLESITEALPTENMDYFSTILFPSIQENYQSKEQVEALLAQPIRYLQLPFKRAYTEEEKIVEVKSVENPFAAGSKVKTEIITYLAPIAKETNKASFSIITQADLSAFEEILKNSILKMLEEGKIDEEKLKELASFKMVISSNEKLIFDLKTGWLSHALYTSLTQGLDLQAVVHREEHTTNITIE